jgi:hypothetical protein
MIMRESQQIAAERHDLAAHAHRSGAEHHGKEDHLTGHESSRQGLEHSTKAYLNSQKQHQGTRAEHATNVVAHEAKEEDIAASPINSGKTGAAQKDHRKKIGFEPQKNCARGGEPAAGTLHFLTVAAMSTIASSH